MDYRAEHDPVPIDLWCASLRTAMADQDSGSSSEDGSEPMEVTIPPNLARELGQDPGVMSEDEEGEVAAERTERTEGGGLVDDGEGPETLDLKKVAQDYSQYLAVNSRQDVSTLRVVLVQMLAWLVSKGMHDFKC